MAAWIALDRGHFILSAILSRLQRLYKLFHIPNKSTKIFQPATPVPTALPFAADSLNGPGPYS